MARFQSVPTFGLTIQMFSYDVASMGQLAARNFEDILQCCLPVFEGLLPAQCNAQVQRLVFIFAQWHGLAKLCCHTTETLGIMKKLTAKLGSELCSFAELTNTMNVSETLDKYARQKKQQAAAQALRSTQTTGLKAQSKAIAHPQMPDGRRKCLFNINTYKVHAIGHYVHTITEFGTTDSYSTQICELQHCFVKNQFERTNKKDVVQQMTQIGDVASVLKRMDLELEQRQVQLQSQDNKCETAQLDTKALQLLLNGQPYTIGLTKRSEDMIASIIRWVHGQQHDDAMKFFIPQLKRFFLACFLGSRNHPKFNEQEIAEIRFHQDHTARQGGWDAYWLDHISYKPCCTDQDILDSFDFVHPSNIIRAIHLIPDFQSGPSNKLLNFAKLIAHDSEEHWDWKHYYVNRFVDRDILMRYLGGGIGHYRHIIHGSENNLGLDQNESETNEDPLDMRGAGENTDVESEDDGSDVESGDERSDGNELICRAQEQVSDKEELSMDEGNSEFGDDVLDNGLEGDFVDVDEDELHGF
ncbi:Maltodextrin phosphorylase [Rhizoctonia solani]|uniref:Maltodextrin phosphorylase n=1 Tax=Rhizoctonia solani TaxID=456999 RepID=A0A8H8SZ62_9AGAM|nr:Maltodextrin phosphorylase [Rhizoctonia solani]QRW23996.1 Maltodextrin phosphorylase [Rhizoctonia solani]